ncbi:DUF2256 domain-containing protein [Elioraea sp.]|uniref:DUF2256 domain-containing protein n=1 Tax=Elioraea sp. TaxID=2185103 RepID=UPI00307D8CD8
MRRKGDLPSKPCIACGRPFAWRRKWARVWDEVRYCSEACRARRGARREPGDAVPQRQRDRRVPGGDRRDPRGERG